MDKDEKHYRENGGPAFPTGYYEADDADHSHYCLQDGMTLRDYFAGQALAGMTGGGWRPGSDESRETLARDTYKMADAMLAARGK